MKLIAQADVVLALGTRLGPFGTLPQHGLDYWPKNAKIIQVDADHTMLGLVKKITRRHLRRREGRRGRRSSRAWPASRSPCDAEPRASARTQISAEKAAWESGARRLDAREATRTAST